MKMSGLESALMQGIASLKLAPAEAEEQVIGNPREIDRFASLGNFYMI